MVWSEQIGASLVVPSDHAAGDGRNYIVIGEDVPAAVVGRITAGLVFRTKYATVESAGDALDVWYWVFGIDTSNAFVISAYYAVKTAQAGAYLYNRYTLIRLDRNHTTGALAITFGYDDWGDQVASPDVTVTGGLKVLGPITATELIGPIVIDNVGDVGINQANLPAFQIGATAPGATVSRLDNNEIASVVIDATTGVESFSNFGISLPTSNSPQQSNGSALVRRDYVDGLIQRGLITITPTAANTPTVGHVTFSPAFSAAPTVMVTANTTVPGTTVTGVAVANVTASGCDIYVTRTSTTSTGVYWFASNG